MTAVPTMECQTAMIECDVTDTCGYIKCVSKIEGCESLLDAAQVIVCDVNSESGLTDEVEEYTDTVAFNPASDGCRAALNMCSSQLNSTMFEDIFNNDTKKPMVSMMGPGDGLQSLLGAIFGGDLNETLAEIESQCNLLVKVSICVVSDEANIACENDEGFPEFRAELQNSTALINNCSAEIAVLREEIADGLGEGFEIPALDLDLYDLFDSNGTDDTMPNIEFEGLLGDLPETDTFNPTSDGCRAALNVCTSNLNGTLFEDTFNNDTNKLMKLGTRDSLQSLLGAIFSGDINETLAEIESQCNLFVDFSICAVSDELNVTCEDDKGFADFRTELQNNTALISNCTEEVAALREEFASGLGDRFGPGLELNLEDLFNTNATADGMPNIDVEGLLHDIIRSNISTVDIPGVQEGFDINTLLDAALGNSSGSPNGN
ncbi:hypothetical protein SARC_09462 [Sphaeroforma arctica JP610]|uniref:Uncharacterized protein n=1 Tax=Sphaeroforma arctica JP610 TaxID=667725 RepID=A0A0L0FMX5_9EUKA|nr:hypothetical protein SARC_09462 [Sphaeroforma arctica JP610]KNC78094.1 hypothetical protein SARC_09462 [Sphaeroforma arctica JP610]|eukprot:XP_014151996.1 hypothetical protein SARC_09462 [Sphaeroforma arctica JP610]